MHRAAGREVARLGIDVFWGVRGLAAEMTAAAEAAGLKTVRFFESSAEAAAAALNEVRAGDLILVKGSRSVETDKVISALQEKFELTGGDKR